MKLAELIAETGAAANCVAAELERTDSRIVFAESCTAGLASAALAQVPGISRFLCGSSVTYQEQTKQQWLAVEESTLIEYTAVSEQVTSQMATNVIAKTAQATISAAVTGHLGPGSPQGMDGVGFMAVAVRNVGESGKSGDTIECVETIGFQMQQSERVQRQWEVAQFVLETVCGHLKAMD